MDKKSLLQLQGNQKNLTYLLLVGFGVAIVHFLITYILEKSNSSFIKFIFTSPSFIISSTISHIYMKNYFPTITYIALQPSSASFADIIVSSISYGIVGVLFASKKFWLQLISAILLFIFLMFPILELLFALMAQSNA